MTSKLHGICHSKGCHLRLHLSEGQCSDFTGADGVLKDLPSAATVMGDQGYDRDKIRKMLSQQVITPYITAQSLQQETSALQQETGSQGSQNRDALFPT